MNDALAALGWNDRWLALYTTAVEGRSPSRPGRVVRHDGVAVLVADGDRAASLPVLAQVDPAPVVGDWVVVDEATGAVVEVLARSSLLRRQDPDGNTVQALVANLDVLLVVCGIDRPVKPGRIQRSAALAWDAGATPVVVLTKADLADEAVVDEVVAGVQAANPGLDVVVTSSVTGQGLDELRALAGGRTIVLLGESGSGKSALTNALAGGEVAATGAVRRGDSKGRHTTTWRELHVLPSGGVLIDTPGIRSVGLTVDPDAVAATFDDVEELGEGCRFRDCAHDTEPGCAVRAAVEAGQLAPQRYEAWQALRKEAESAALRADAHAQHQADRRFGRMAREAARHTPTDPRRS